MNLAKLSPLYEYWNSDQGDEAEKKRLLKINSNEPASTLFRNEPYKWENLYQSVVKNIIKGDESSIKALMVLLATNKNPGDFYKAFLPRNHTEIKKIKKIKCLISRSDLRNQHVIFLIFLISVWFLGRKAL